MARSRPPAIDPRLREEGLIGPRGDLAFRPIKILSDEQRQALLRGRKGGRRVQHERPVQQAIVAFHARCVVDPALAILASIPNGEKRDKVTAALLSGSRRAREVAQYASDGVWHDPLAADRADGLRPAGLGVLPGAPDLILLLPGARVVLIEVKAPAGPGHRAGRSSTTQRGFQKAAEAMGHTYVLLDSVDAYEALLVAEGVLLRGSAGAVPANCGTTPGFS